MHGFINDRSMRGQRFELITIEITRSGCLKDSIPILYIADYVP